MTKQLELYDLIIEAAKGNHSKEWRRWSRDWAVQGTSPMYLDENGINRAVGKDQIEHRLSRAVEVFSWVPEACWEAHLELAEIREDAGKWEKAIKSHRYVLENTGAAFVGTLPDIWDCRSTARTSVLDRQIQASSHVANIYHRELQDTEEAISWYKRVVDKYGIAHKWGANVATGLHELGEDLVLPQKAVLIWGGGARAHDAWSKRLKSMGYVAHSVGLHRISAGHLAQYPLVVLVRTGTIAFTPHDVLALRHYAATGGSLLVVVSPGWRHAAMPYRHGRVVVASLGQWFLPKPNLQKKCQYTGVIGRMMFRKSTGRGRGLERRSPLGSGRSFIKVYLSSDALHARYHLRPEMDRACT